MIYGVGTDIVNIERVKKDSIQKIEMALLKEF